MSIGHAVGKALRSVRGDEEKIAMHRHGGDRLPRLRVTCDTFEDGERIPKQHSVDGDETPPRLHVAEVPGGTKELVVMVEDPDAPTPMPFVHWLVHGLSPTTTLVSGGKTGKTTMRHDRFDGPAPPPGHGPHHYHFQVFALDRELGLDDGVGRTELLDAMEGHVIAAGEIVGIYER